MRELSLHILDIVQNSVAACADAVTISIEEDTERDVLSFSVADNGRGMEQETADHAADSDYTTRTTGKGGAGLPLLKAVAIACNGSFAIESSPGAGTLVTASFPMRHTDRPPLGDMVSTMLALMTGREEIEYHYRHRKGSRVFAFASRDLTTVLDGLPFHHPEVYRWLKEYLIEGEKSLDKKGRQEPSKHGNMV